MLSRPPSSPSKASLWRNSSTFTLAQYSDDANYSLGYNLLPTIYTGIKNSGSGSSLYKNGSLVSTSGSPNLNLNTGASINFGTGFDPNAQRFNGNIQEMIIFSSSISGANRTVLENNQYKYYKVQ